MVVRSDVRSRDYKISRMSILSHFLRNGVTLASILRASGAPLSIFAFSLNNYGSLYKRNMGTWSKRNVHPHCILVMIKTRGYKL